MIRDGLVSVSVYRNVPRNQAEGVFTYRVIYKRRSVFQLPSGGVYVAQGAAGSKVGHMSKVWRLDLTGVA